MRIALDIDDTISRHPEFFSVLTIAFQAAGHEILIVTFRSERASAEDDLNAWGIAYDELILCDGSVDLDALDAWKGRVCAERGIDVFFEDDPLVLQGVGTETVCFMPINKDAHDLEACGKKLWYRQTD